jgi:hypothetical protein
MPITLSQPWREVTVADPTQSSLKVHALAVHEDWSPTFPLS